MMICPITPPCSWYPMTLFEYTQTFVPLPYKTVTSGVLMFKSTDETTEPDIQGYLSSPETLRIEPLRSRGVGAGQRSADQSWPRTIW